MYNGIVNVYKEPGYTSHDVVAKLRGIYGQKKVGHTGTLDPMARGVLIVLLGQATKLSDLILTSSKEYIATARLGIVTDTDDITGNVISRNSVEYEAEEDESQTETDQSIKAEVVTRERLQEVLKDFVGKSMQIPPMYSAVKVNGKKLYEYARAGIEIEREPRPVEIYSLELLDCSGVSEDGIPDGGGVEFTFRVKCSKGTYIRALIRDIGERLGTGATMTGLLRDEVNGIRCEDGFRIEDLQKLKEEGGLDSTVLSMDELLSDIPRADVLPSGKKLLENGNRLELDNVDGNPSKLRTAEFFRVYHDGRLKGLYTFDNEKKNYKVFKML